MADESATWASKLPACVQTCCTVRCLSDLSELPLLLRWPAHAPLQVLVLCLGVYTVFLLVYLPALLLSLAVTWWGTALVALGVVLLIGRSVASFLLFPGASPSVKTDVEREYTRRNVMLLTHLAAAGKAMGLAAAEDLAHEVAYLHINESLGRVMFVQPMVQALSSLRERRKRLAAHEPRRSQGDYALVGTDGGDAEVDRLLQDIDTADADQRRQEEALLQTAAALIYHIVFTVLQLNLQHHGIFNIDVELLNWIFQLESVDLLAGIEASGLPESLQQCLSGVEIHMSDLVAAAKTKPIRTWSSATVRCAEAVAEVVSFMKPPMKPRLEFPYNVVNMIVTSVSSGLGLGLEEKQRMLSLAVLRQEMLVRTRAEAVFFRVPRNPVDASVGLFERLAERGVRLCRFVCACFAKLLQLARAPARIVQLFAPCMDELYLSGAIIHPEDAAMDRRSKFVVFCNPNAGLFETLPNPSPSPDAADWIRFYTSAGYSVCLWNYRGYGGSQGYPTPRFLGQDGVQVVRQLVLQHGASHVVIHGESIGGVVASYVCGAAADDPILAESVACTILDRTLASVGGAASGLLGSWASGALAAFTGWHADLISSLLRSPQVHKVICCDPNDAVIANQVSVKAGVAIKMVLGEVDEFHLSPFAGFLKELVPTSAAAGASRCIRPLLPPCVPGPQHFTTIGPDPPLHLQLSDKLQEAPDPMSKERMGPLTPFPGQQDGQPPGHPPPPPPVITFQAIVDEEKTETADREREREHPLGRKESVAQGMALLNRIDEQLVAHFSACIRYIGARARRELRPVLARNRKRVEVLASLSQGNVKASPSGPATRLSSLMTASPSTSASVDPRAKINSPSGIEAMLDKRRPHASSSSSSSSSTRPGPKPPQFLSSNSAERAGRQQDGHFGLGALDDDLSGGEEDSDEEKESEDLEPDFPGTERAQAAAVDEKGMALRDPWEDWRSWVFQSGVDGGFAQLWAVLARIQDGGCEFLGISAARGFDGLRAWISAAIVWGARDTLEGVLRAEGKHADEGKPDDAGEYLHDPGSAAALEALVALFAKLDSLPVSTAGPAANPPRKPRTSNRESVMVESVDAFPRNLRLSVIEGEYILGRILGSRDLRRDVATDPAVLFVKSILRAIAALHRGALLRVNPSSTRLSHQDGLDERIGSSSPSASSAVRRPSGSGLHSRSSSTDFEVVDTEGDEESQFKDHARSPKPKAKGRVARSARPYLGGQPSPSRTFEWIVEMCDCLLQQQQQKQQQQQQSKRMQEEVPKIPRMGVLLPLRCGHNNPYSAGELDALRHQIETAEGMLVATNR